MNSLISVCFFFFKETITFENGETKGMGDLADAVQRNPVLSVEVAVLDFVKKGVHPVETHRAEERLEWRV